MLLNKYFKLYSLIFLVYLHTEVVGKSINMNFESDLLDPFDNNGFNKISKSLSNKAKLVINKNRRVIKISDISFEFSGKIACMIVQAIEDKNIHQIKGLINQNLHIQKNTELLTTFMNMAGLYNYIDIAKEFINLGADIHGKTMLGDNKPIIYAVLCNKLDFLSLLLQNGADPNERGKNKITPLMHASKKGYIEIVKFLLENGADPRSQDLKLFTPLNYALNYAIMNDKYETVKLIRQKLSEEKKTDLQKVPQAKPEIIIPRPYIEIIKKITKANMIVIGIVSYLGYKALTRYTKPPYN